VLYFGRLIVVMCLMRVVSLPDQVFADTSSLEQRLADLEQQVAILKREIENNKEEAKAQAGTTPVITATAKDGFSIKSPDGNYALKIGGYTQVVAREFTDNKKGELGYASSIIPRRVRLVIQGTVARDFDYFVQPDFGFSNTYSSITATAPSAYAVVLQDAWIDWKHFPEAAIKAGKFKPPFDLENLQDTRYTTFTELGLTGNLSPSRDIGVQISGSLFDDIVNYAGGIFDGAADKENGNGGFTTAPGNTNEKSGMGRIFIKPFKNTNIEPLRGLGIGYAASYGKVKGGDIPSYVTPGQAPIFTYNSNVIAAGPQIRTEPQVYYYYKSLGILAEKVNSQEELEYKGVGNNYFRDKPTNKAWEVTGTYVLTGEDASYNGVTPRHEFEPSGGHWGAFELAGRIGELKLDSSIFSENFANLSTSISKENAWGIGMNWYLNRNVKLAADFEQTKFRRGAPNGKATDDRKTENLFTGLAQLSF
jgi:phosphate-selective porin OprO/OprP